MAALGVGGQREHHLSLRSLETTVAGRHVSACRGSVCAGAVGREGGVDNCRGSVMHPDRDRSLTQRLCISHEL